MTTNLEKIILVYQCKRRPHTSKCVYFRDAQPGDDWEYVTTIEPASWIEYLLNNPAKRAKHIESLMK